MAGYLLGLLPGTSTLSITLLKGLAALGLLTSVVVVVNTGDISVRGVSLPADRLIDLYGGLQKEVLTTYTGLPLGAFCKSLSIWDGVIEWFEKKLAVRKHQYLCIGAFEDCIPAGILSLLPQWGRCQHAQSVVARAKLSPLIVESVVDKVKYNQSEVSMKSLPSESHQGISGDLYLVLHVDGKHGIWRDGLNLYSRVNIDYTEAILGTVIKVETAEGSRDLQIPSGIQPGDTVKMSKMGVPDINKPFMRGDHYFIVNVRIPTAVRKRSIRSLETGRIHPESLESSCTRDSNFDKHNLDHASSNRDKDAASLWNSIKDLLRPYKYILGLRSEIEHETISSQAVGGAQGSDRVLVEE
ncbi:hypothetical protein RJ639_041628 [Escallonia herrerae]|uniref:Chaperone DnaJ C-terminal domain-containing protein n=1 Tax=Escallonia herrerae TaxID=1293975 RepID=A0AA89B6G1_9ASTE|nr:hypothetical protein RJ639_041628 [Escallonia herrerae]